MFRTLLPKLIHPARLRPIAALTLVAFLAACGGAKKPEEEAKPKPKKKAPEPVEGEGTAVDGWIVLGENPKWKPVQPLFEAYTKREVTGLHNPMRAQLVYFVERPVPTSSVGNEAEEDQTAKKEEVPVSPFTKFSLGSMSLIVLVTGVAQPKAVLLDQDGNQLVVVRGDHLGSEGGIVKAITQYELQVSVPGEPDVVKSLKPPLNPVEELDAETQSAGKKPEL